MQCLSMIGLLKILQANYGKPSYELNDDEIKKSVNDYVKGPISTIVGHIHSNNRGEGSDKAIQDRITNDIAYHKMMVNGEVDQNLQHLKNYFQTLRPAAGAAAPGVNADGTVPVPPASWIGIFLKTWV